MADDKKTKKVKTATTRRTDRTPAKQDLPAQLLEIVRKPGVVVTVLAAVGLTGNDIVSQVNALLSLNLPAYALLGLAAGYVFIRMAYDYLKSQRAMAENVRTLVEAFEEFREWTRDRLESGDDSIGNLVAKTGANSERLTFLEAWKAAHDPDWKPEPPKKAE